MLKCGLIFTYAIIACHLASGSVQGSEEPASLSFSPEQMKQLSGICNTALGQLQHYTSNQQEGKVPPPEKVIPSGFEYIGTRHFYISKFARKNWFAAGETCRQIGGQLATIQSDEELAAISPHLKRESYWIDMNDLVASGKYVSWSSNKAASYFKWHPNQSEEKLNNEHCVDLFQAEMYNESCFKKSLFICETIEKFDIAIN